MGAERAPNAADGWTLIDRVRFEPLWDDLPALTVLASLPGWGRTEWMRAAANRIQQIDPECGTQWCTSREEVVHVLEGSAPAEGRRVIFIDDVLAHWNDPLWGALTRAAEENRGLSFVVSSLDAPLPSLLGGVRVQVLDERDLRFTEDEILALVAANGITVGTDTRDDLVARMRGCPWLVRGQLERVRARRASDVWASLAFVFEPALVARIDAQVGSDEERSGIFLRMLRDGTLFRSFALDLLDPAPDSATEQAMLAQLDRLEAIPFGTVDIDDETGHRGYVWSEAVWREIELRVSAADHLRRLREAFERTKQSGRITASLFYLLAAADYAAAEELVFDQFRRFLIFTDGVTQSALLAVDESDLLQYPSLSLLASELRLRARGANAQSIREAENTLRTLVLDGGDPPLRRFRVLCRLAMAAALAGHRRQSVSFLERVADAVAPGGSVILREADRSRETADRVAADLFLAFWAGIQTDQHDMALRFTELMGEYGDPTSIVTQIDELTALTELDFAGLRSMERDARRPERIEYSHAAPFVLIEEGADADAYERSHPLRARVRPTPTRSAPDALLLLTEALLVPARLTAARINAPVELSRAFWDDGHPSTFILFAAVVAHLRTADIAEARALVDGHENEDWFVCTSRGMIDLADGALDTAIARLEEASRATALPRLRMVSGLLAASATLRVGFDDAAAARIRALWDEIPSPRLLRFALRFVTAEVIDALRAVAPLLGESITDVLAQSAADPRPTERVETTRPTATELEILRLLSRGKSNTEIAEMRGVSHNTIRTQLRVLYKKLAVENRAEAVASALAGGLLGDED